MHIPINTLKNLFLGAKDLNIGKRFRNVVNDLKIHPKVNVDNGQTILPGMENIANDVNPNTFGGQTFRQWAKGGTQNPKYKFLKSQYENNPGADTMGNQARNLWAAVPGWSKLGIGAVGATTMGLPLIESGVGIASTLNPNSMSGNDYNNLASYYDPQSRALNALNNKAAIFNQYAGMNQGAVQNAVNYGTAARNAILAGNKQSLADYASVGGANTGQTSNDIASAAKNMAAQSAYDSSGFGDTPVSGSANSNPGYFSSIANAGNQGVAGVQGAGNQLGAGMQNIQNAMADAQAGYTQNMINQAALQNNQALNQQNLGFALQKQDIINQYAGMPKHMVNPVDIATATAKFHALSIIPQYRAMFAAYGIKNGADYYRYEHPVQSQLPPTQG